MGVMNFRNAYNFDPEEPDSQDAGGLLGLLQAAMQQRAAERGPDVGSTTNGYGGSQRDLLMQLAALQTAQSPNQSFVRDSAQTSSRQPDPNFRRLMRVSAPDRPGFDSTIDRSGAAGSQHPAQPPQIGGRSFDDAGDSSALSPTENAPITMAQVPMPMPLPGPGPIPGPVQLGPDGLPAAPDWLQKLWTNLHRLGSYGGGGEEKSCLDRWDEEDLRCDMFKRPTTDRWKRACQARAADRLRLCNRNGGTPDPNEPPEYWWNDIPNDPAGR